MDFIHAQRLAEMNLALSIVVTSVIIPDSHNPHTIHHERVIVGVSDPFQIKRMEVTTVLLPEASLAAQQNRPRVSMTGGVVRRGMVRLQH